MRCRKGDLALVISGDYVGAIVEVIRFRGEVNGMLTDGSVPLVVDAWEVSPPRCPVGVHKNYPSMWFIAEDSKLLPIRPDELKETEGEKELTV